MKKSTIVLMAAALAFSTANVFAAANDASEDVASRSQEISYILNPASGSSVTEIGQITITFAAGENVGFYDTRPAVATLENTETGVYYYGNPSFVGRDEDGQMVYSFEFGELSAEDTETIYVPGQYSLTIRGAYTSTIDDDGEESEPVDLPVITADYTIVYPVTYFLNPDNGANVEEISTIQLTFGPGANVGFYEGRETVSLENLETGDVYYSIPFFEGRQEDGSTLYSLEFTELGSSEVETFTLPGTYLLTVKGLYTTTIDDDGEESEPVDLPVINASYTIVYPISYTLNPENGANLEELSEVVITFAEGANVGFEPGRGNEVVLEDVATGDYYYSEPEFLGRDEDGRMSYKFTFTELGNDEPVSFTQPGEYILTIRSLYTSYIDDDGEESEPVALPVITATYNIVYPVNYTLNPDSGANLDEITSISITFAEGANVGFYGGRETTAVLENLDTEEVWYCESPFFVGRNENGAMEYILEFTEAGSDETVTISEQGNYKLSIRGVYLTTIDDDGEESEPVDLPVIIALYYVTGNGGDNGDAVAKLFDNVDSFNVYNVNGMKVLGNAKADALQSLKPGLYIINGKKVLVK